MKTMTLSDESFEVLKDFLQFGLLETSVYELADKQEIDRYEVIEDIYKTMRLMK